MTHLRQRKEGGKQRGILPERSPSSGHQLQHSPQKSFNLKSKGENIIIESTVKSLKPAQKKPQYILLPEMLFLKASFLYTVFWRTCGSSCSWYRVVDNRSSTCVSTLITAQLWLVRPPGHGGYVNRPTLVGNFSGSSSVCLCFLRMCLLRWPRYQLSPALLPWYFPTEEGQIIENPCGVLENKIRDDCCQRHVWLQMQSC